jgi:hypothetical protein
MADCQNHSGRQVGLTDGPNFRSDRWQTENQRNEFLNVAVERPRVLPAVVNEEDAVIFAFNCLVLSLLVVALTGVFAECRERRLRSPQAFHPDISSVWESTMHTACTAGSALEPVVALNLSGRGKAR